MDDATQKLVDDARKAQRAVYLATEKDVADDLARIIGGLADAFEAAQRPPVSPEQREALIDLLTPFGRPLVEWPDRLADAILARFSLPPVSPEQREALDELIADVLIAERDEWPRDPGDAPSEVLAGAVTDALLARFSLPVLDVEEVARVIQIAANRSEDRSPGQTRAEWYAAALVAAIQNGELSAPARRDLPARPIDDKTG